MKASNGIVRAAKWCLIALLGLATLDFLILWQIHGRTSAQCLFVGILGFCRRPSTVSFSRRDTTYNGATIKTTNATTNPQIPATLPSYTNSSSYGPPFNALEELHHALQTMQDYYFAIWVGKYTSSIDWTGAVIGTFLSASLFSLTRSLEYILPPASTQPSTITLQGEKVENEVNKYFSQSVAYYFGENAMDIRFQAFDDMLWVVLGWLESVRFINMHSNAHYNGPNSQDEWGGGAWYGNQFVPSFAHRAHIFYDLASQGWDTKLCGGGMNWNPRLTPYKNAITNELYISASVAMYLYFPGDRNPSPYITTAGDDDGVRAEPGETKKADITRPHDPVYLSNAVRAYDWLKNSNMTNEKGLYVDGFHITGWLPNGTIGTGKCDERNEMVYTYNQGVILSGLRGLWEGTGNIDYLADGHKLVRNVIKATGWKSATSPHNPEWSGLGRNGILEEICDSRGSCSQNGQTFKGIYFHHLTLFCEPLPTKPVLPGKTFAAGPTERSLHEQSCREYASWVVWNARGAMSTRDDEGRYGAWWGAGIWNGTSTPPVRIVDDAEDYRNEGLGDEKKWGRGWNDGLGVTPPLAGIPGGGQIPFNDDMLSNAPPAMKGKMTSPEDPAFPRVSAGSRDLNGRGRGRTVETQGGGVAVLRAMWELVHLYAKDTDSITNDDTDEDTISRWNDLRSKAKSIQEPTPPTPIVDWQVDL